LQRADVRLLYDRFDPRALAERLVTDFASHLYFPAELELLFLSAGFEIAHQHGDYRFVRVDRTSPYVVTVARRPRADLSFASTDGARVLLIGGLPFAEAILMWWNFVARTPEDIRIARDDWEAHRRFGNALAYQGPRLAAPELTRLAQPNPVS
jgi:hypothetical protein